MAGALREQEYRDKLAAAGFAGIEVKITSVYDLTDPLVASILSNFSESERSELNGAVVSAFIRAKKPGPVAAGY